MSRILVTGATGMIGGAIARALIARGDSVRALVRRPDARLPAGAVPVMPSGLRDAADECEALVHCAGVLSAGSAFDARRDRELPDANERLTATIVEIAREAGIARLVLMSSVAVYGIHQPEPVTEDTPPAPRSRYGRSKWRQERAALAAAGEALDIVIVRPSIVTGPGDRHFARLLSPLRRLPLLPVPRGGYRFDLAHVDDVAALTLAALDRGRHGRAYNATSGLAVSLADLAAAIAPRRVRPLPDAAFRAGAGALHGVLRLVGYRDAALAGPVALAYWARGGGHFSIDRARDELGFTPPARRLADLLDDAAPSSPRDSSDAA